MSRQKLNLTGKRFGRLTVLEETTKRGTHRYWLCQCDCGSPTKEIRQSHLQSGKTISCGCALKDGDHKVDLTGQRFGKLTAIAPTSERKHGKVIWECKCSCGNPNPVLVPSTYLTNGDTQSCGCLKKEQEKINFVDGYDKERVDGVNTSLLLAKLRTDSSSGIKGVYFHKARQKWYAQITVGGQTYRSSLVNDKERAIDARIELEHQYHMPYLNKKETLRKDIEPGTRFGKLSVIDKSYTKENNKRTYYYYKCICDCGNTKDVEHYQLLNGFSKSCGCSKKAYNIGAIFGDWEIVEEIDNKTRLCRCNKCGYTRSYKTGTLYHNPTCEHKVNVSEIDKYMTLGEAVSRWGITSDRLKDRIKVARKNRTLETFINKGWAKYSVGDGSKQGTWILSTMLMEYWYGAEPIKEAKDEDENNK